MYLCVIRCGIYVLYVVVFICYTMWYLCVIRCGIYVLYVVVFMCYTLLCLCVIRCGSYVLYVVVFMCYTVWYLCVIRCGIYVLYVVVYWYPNSWWFVHYTLSMTLEEGPSLQQQQRQIHIHKYTVCRKVCSCERYRQLNSVLYPNKHILKSSNIIFDGLV